MEIYCVKIRQKQGGDRYFPFERLYIVPETFITRGSWKKIFREMLVVESTEVVLKALNTLSCTLERTIPENGPVVRTPVPWASAMNFANAVPDMNEKRIVIPTYIRHSALGYIYSQLLPAKLQGLELSLYLQDRVIPSVCYQCTNLAQKYAGGCYLTSEDCRRNLSLTLGPDSSPQKGNQQACLTDSVKTASPV